MTYVDGFVAAVPTANKEAYRKHAADSVPVFKGYGALAMVENWGVDVPDGEVTSLPMAVKRKEDETVVFSWVIWPDKETRDKAWEKLMSDPAMTNMEMPFDGKRMIFGGFETILEA
ncbi:DUF1428 domain-containing protein [Sandaracinobacter sp. RS1-74]|uniref:DUF1428 domain-containing protein n=1 Tax=Sandaracinobacteroides sayramensis TaxID=2913411 RepID=UPI001EDA48C6|nr:DUF1428 domain-containing protein [Sandaracinobacteroides sayramensis]MCG2842497.1 DUF1428 domain-containing protein [Sandaracinobacteroides sayramensis]